MHFSPLGSLAEKGVANDQIVFLIPDSVCEPLLQIREIGWPVHIGLCSFIISPGNTFHDGFFIFIAVFHALDGIQTWLRLQSFVKMKIKGALIFQTAYLIFPQPIDLISQTFYIASQEAFAWNFGQGREILLDIGVIFP